MQNNIGDAFVFAPFIIAGGAALYFTCGAEPGIPMWAAGAAIAASIMMLQKTQIITRAIALFAFGFFYAMVYTNAVDTPLMTRNMRDAALDATVENIDYTPDKHRIYLQVDASDINAGDGRAIVRVSAPGDSTPPQIGDKIRANVGLFRPAPADAPGAFDYARWAYFNKLSATGYMDEYTVLADNGGGGINSVRKFLHEKANSHLTDGLVLGYKNILTQDERQYWTTAGIGHVWSISGFHMTLVAGWLFAIFYMIFRCIPRITRAYPARIPAMFAAWCGLVGYLMISGVGVATVRAFLMTSLMFAAVALGRSAISMRNICIAFCIIFLINPHNVMQAGFQLSFAAIFGLIWFWGVVRPKMPRGRISKIIFTAVMTSLVATIFTTPFVAAHFHTIPTYGLIGNLTLLPIFSLLIMPLVMVGTFAAAIGIHAPLELAHWIYDFALLGARQISALPMAEIITPHIPGIALVIMTAGLVGLMFIKPGRYKINVIICSLAMAAGCTMTALAPRPMFFATSDHELVAFANDDAIEFNKARASNHYFTFDTWKQMLGLPAGTKNIRRAHDRGVYDFKTQNFHLVYIQKFVPLMRNIEKLCHDPDIDYIVSYFDIQSPSCGDKILRGGFVIDPSGRVRNAQLNRRWHNHS